MADEDFFIPQPRGAGADHLWADVPGTTPLEIMELIDTLRDYIGAHTVAPYQVDREDPLAREACWALVSSIAGKPVRHPAEVTAQWYVAQREAECGASVRRLGKRLEPSVVWLDPTDVDALPILSRFAAWMVQAGGERARFGPLRAAEIYRDLVPVLSGHGVSRTRPIEVWRETLGGLDALHRWSGGVHGPYAHVATRAQMAYARLGAEVGRRADAVECLLRLRDSLLQAADSRALTQDEEMLLVDIDLELAFLDGTP